MKNLILIAVALVAGFVGGLAVNRSLAEKTPKIAAQVAPDLAMAEKLGQAEKQITSLEKQLEAAQAQLKAAKSEAATTPDTSAPAAKSTDESTVIVSKDGNLDLMEQLKERLPADEFEKVQDAFAQMRAKLNQRAKSRQDYLASIDTSRMTEAERANHQRYLELFAKREEISQKMRGGQFNQQVLQEMASLSQEMGKVAKEERTVLMRQVAGELGYQGEEAEIISETVKNIYDCTNASPLGGLSDMLEGFGDGGAVSVSTEIIAP